MSIVYTAPIDAADVAAMNSTATTFGPLRHVAPPYGEGGQPPQMGEADAIAIYTGYKYDTVQRWFSETSANGLVPASVGKAGTRFSDLTDDGKELQKGVRSTTRRVALGAGVYGLTRDSIYHGNTRIWLVKTNYLAEASRELFKITSGAYDVEGGYMLSKAWLSMRITGTDSTWTLSVTYNAKADTDLYDEEAPVVPPVAETADPIDE